MNLRWLGITKGRNPQKIFCGDWVTWPLHMALPVYSSDNGQVKQKPKDYYQQGVYLPLFSFMVSGISFWLL